MRSARTLTAHADSVYDVTWSADGARLASCGRDGRVVVWSANGAVEHIHDVSEPVVAVRILEGDVVAATRSGTMAAWSLATGSRRWKTEVDATETLAAAPSGELVVGSASGYVTVHDSSTGRELQRLAIAPEDSVLYLTWSADGRTLAVATRGVGVVLVAWPSGKRLRTVAFAPPNRCIVYACAFAPDSTTCAASLHFRRGGEIGTTDDPDLYEIALWRPSEEEPDLSATLLGHVSWMRGLAFSPRGDVLVSGGFDERVCVWDPEFHELRAMSREHQGAVYAVAFSPDGTSFATASADRTVRVWDVAAIDATPPDATPRLDSHEAILLRLTSLMGAVGRNPVLEVAQDVAEGLLRIESLRDMSEAVDRVVDAAFSLRMTELGRAVTQTLTVRGEQARRVRDDVTAFRCARLNAEFNERIQAYLVGSIAKHGNEGGLTAAVQPAGPSLAAYGVFEIIDEVVAGSVPADDAAMAIAGLTPTAGDLTLAVARLQELWPDVLAGRKARATVTAASRILAQLAPEYDDDVLSMLADDVYGRLLATGGDNPGAVGRLERAVEAARRIGDDEPLQAMLGNLGNVYRNVGRLRESRLAYEEALALAKKGSHYEGQVNHLTNLAIVESDLGNTAAQAELLRDARAIASARGLNSLSRLSNNLATLYREMGDDEGAVALSREAVAAAEEADDPAGRALAAGTLAHTLADLGDDAEARHLYEESLAGARQFDDRGSEVHALAGLSRLAERDGDLERAAQLAAEAVEVSERAQLPPRLMRALARLSRVRKRMGDAGAAIELLERAATVGETLRDEITRSSEGPLIQGSLADVYDDLVLQLVDSDRVEDAFAAAERGRAALLLRRLRGDATAAPTDARQLALDLERMAPNAVLAAYYLTGSELLVFVVRPGKPLALERRRLPRTLIDEVVTDFENEVRAGPDAIGETWLRLSQDIAEPLAPYLVEGSVLLLAPHRGLHNLPLHALRLGDARMIERWPVAYLPSASSFRYLVATGTRAAVPAAVIGAHFTEEAQAVAAALGVEPDLVGTEIDVEAALRVLEDTDLVHVSAHGFFSRREPDLSGWILRPSDDLRAYLDVRAKPAWLRTASQSQAIGEFADWADTSILSASDLAGRRLGASVVVASACESGVISVDPSDDPSGLVPALLEAGVSGVVATLWLVDPQRTRTAMLELHDALARTNSWDGVPRAVQRAALAVKDIDPHPFFWAPYVAIGGFRQRKGTT